MATPSWIWQVYHQTLNRLLLRRIGEFLDICGNSTHVHKKITEAFPALASAGGYEILRIADDKSKNLMEIPMSGSGYSVSYLKGTLGQAKAYIRTEPTGGRYPKIFRCSSRADGSQSCDVPAFDPLLACDVLLPLTVKRSAVEINLSAHSRKICR